MYSLMSMRIRAFSVVEEELGQGPGQLGLAHAGGAEEDERARWAGSDRGARPGSGGWRRPRPAGPRPGR